MMSPNGLHYSMMMQMARRGGRKSGRRIEPGKIDGYIQAFRDNAAAESKVKKQPSPRKEGPVGVGTEGGSRWQRFLRGQDYITYSGPNPGMGGA